MATEILSLRERKAPSLLLLLGGLTALDAMSIDIYIPATPQLQAALQAQPSQVQSALSAFFIGIVFGQILWGPLSDRFGRRRPLLAGLLLYCVSSLLCASVQDVHSFILARALQAVGGSAGLVITRAIVRDLYRPEESSRIFALLMQVLGATSILSPLAGGGLLLVGSWRLIFGALTVIGAVLLIGVWKQLPETLAGENRAQARLQEVAASAGHLLRSWRFMAPTLAGALTLAAMFAILTGSAYFYVQGLNWTPLSYSVLYGFTGVLFILACQLNVMALSRWRSQRICNVALILQAIFGAMLTLTFLRELPGAISVSVLMCCLMAVLGFIISNATADAMNAAGVYSGLASSLVGIIQFSLSTLVVPLVTITVRVGQNMALTVLVCAVGALICGLLSRPPLQTD